MIEFTMVHTKATFGRNHIPQHAGNGEQKQQMLGDYKATDAPKASIQYEPNTHLQVQHKREAECQGGMKAHPNNS